MLSCLFPSLGLSVNPLFLPFSPPFLVDARPLLMNYKAEVSPYWVSAKTSSPARLTRCCHAKKIHIFYHSMLLLFFVTFVTADGTERRTQRGEDRGTYTPGWVDGGMEVFCSHGKDFRSQVDEVISVVLGY